MAKMTKMKSEVEDMKSALEVIERQFGKGSLIRLGDREVERVPVISTGRVSIDSALVIGGLPRGRITEIYGPEASGKTTLALHTIAEAQKSGGIAAFIDAEHALDPNYAKKIGIDIDNLWVSQPDYGEQALEIAEMLVRSAAVDIIVVDSVAALVPKSELSGDMGDVQVGLQARLMSQALRKLTATVAKSKTALVFINQTRMKIGVMGYGSPETTTGGVALKFYATVRIELTPGAQVKVGNDVVGRHIYVKVVKNKLAPPFRIAELDMMFGEGFSRSLDLLDTSARLGIVNKSGTWYSLGDTRLGQGREASANFLAQNPDLATQLEIQVRKNLEIPIPDYLLAEQKGKENQ